MKKLLLVPTILITAFLAFAFVAPAAAGSAIRAVAPVVQAALPDAVLAGNGSTSTNARSTQSAGSGAAPLLQNSNTTSQSHIDRDHPVATSGHPHCGRFGNGFHGGKHNLVCPNEHFPPAS